MNYDLTIISNLNMADGIGRQGAGLLSCVKNELKTNTLLVPPVSYKDVPNELMPIIAKTFDNQYGKVCFWTYILGLDNDLEKIHASIKSPIKIAYSMFESSRIPDFWVAILNKYYNLVVVPDEWLVQVYKESGVKIPIFVLPLGISIEDFLKEPIKTEPNEVFTFGMSGGLIARKNHLKVLKAFKKACGNNNIFFRLSLHGRFGPIKEKIDDEVKKYISDGVSVQFLSTPLSRYEYLKWFKNLDCYVYPSQGEGFSITPRESLALGIPCIITNNTAHKTLVNTNYFKSIPSNIKIPAKYEYFKGKQFGNCFDCEVDDIVKAMKDIVLNYYEWLDKAAKGKEWVKQYTWGNLKNKYLSLLKPNKIIFGDKNIITDDSLIIGDKNLYNIYCSVFNK